ncbi:hypothetical protein [Anaerocolumna xylanovorans]|uniref:Uncharacterized protein n=1 Tax=Anaerocolumna xylanovorans DSM 12503 TaxID=1121345 RepID=A0A1M7YFM4_9FIRM|nr:hypothetical protein [Anaerocolumna xylanovorans]SHO51386.1 hypothetical protein SAMN02745217_03165 [Anaerocolumna xylanovorans DSM 12503]
MDNNKHTGYYSKEDLRNVLRQYFSDYSMWMRFLIVSRVSNLGDQEVILNRILEIPIDLSGLFQIYYDKEMTDVFENIFRTHIKLSIDLVEAVIAGDTATFNRTMTVWNANTKALSSQLALMNPYWEQQQLENLFSYLLSMTLEEATKRKNMQYADDIYQYNNIEYFVLMIADILWNGMVKKFYP